MRHIWEARWMQLTAIKQWLRKENLQFFALRKLKLQFNAKPNRSDPSCMKTELPHPPNSDSQDFYSPCGWSIHCIAVQWVSQRQLQWVSWLFWGGAQTIVKWSESSLVLISSTRASRSGGLCLDCWKKSRRLGKPHTESFEAIRWNLYDVDQTHEKWIGRLFSVLGDTFRYQ